MDRIYSQATVETECVFKAPSEKTIPNSITVKGFGSKETCYSEVKEGEQNITKVDHGLVLVLF